MLKKIGIVRLLLIVIIIEITLLLSGGLVKSISKNDIPKRNYVIVIDAGHGGIDGGAEGVTTGVSEKELNLQIAKHLKGYFDNAGFITVMTRIDDNGLYGTTEQGFKKRDLQKRVEITKKAKGDIFISIHLNKYSSPARRGAQVFFNKNNANAKKLADSIQSQLNILKEATRMYDAISGDYYLLNALDISAVIVECGFLSNPIEEKLLISDEYRKKLAKAIFEGSLRYLVNA